MLESDKSKISEKIILIIGQKSPSWIDFVTKHGFIEEINEALKRLMYEIKED